MPTFQFHPVVARWFEQTFGTPTEAQQRGWPAIQNREHTLLAAPTGSGKTLAAFFAELDLLFREGLEGKLPDTTRVLYVSPLKALSNDIHKNLEEPLRGIRQALAAATGQDIEVRAEVRTGDTPASRRQAMLRRPPHILVTTPESFYLLLTSVSGRKLLRPVRTIIVDEIHALVGNRRGSHLSLSMERLAALVDGPLQRIGLSATQKPIEEVARFLVGNRGPGDSNSDPRGSPPRCTIIDAGQRRELDLAIEVPRSPLEAVMSNEVWAEVYTRLAELIEQHRTTLVFVNTRRLAERVTHHLTQKLGAGKVASHHGSLAARLRLEAEDRLKRGELKALVATASLELGIDIGSVDLVCQVGPTRSIATLLQRVGRAEHRRGGIPKGRVFPLSRDELIECAATLESVHRRELDAVEIPRKPLDILAQQIVACAATEDWREDQLFALICLAYPYRDLRRDEFDQVVHMLAEGFSTKRGRRAALIHHDAVNHRIRARRGAGLLALTSGGAIPDNADYRVLLEPGETFIGTVNEDFAVESLAGDIFQLGNASWRILRINAGTVRVADAEGQPPNIPFWLGEAPGRTAEVSRAVSDLRRVAELAIQQSDSFVAAAADPANSARIAGAQPRSGSPTDSAVKERIARALLEIKGLPETAATQLADYFAETYRILGAIPSQETLVIERFFDESGGMQLVIHSPFGIRINRAWGLALRKRFCRSFNFELQAAASDDAIVLSLGTQHSFALEDVFHYLHSNTVRDLLVQALLDSPMFPTRWRWNATRALALPRQRGGRKIAAPLQRMESENLLASVFPDQLACLENIAGDREIPDHPLVRQTIDDCLDEAMDIDRLICVLKGIESGSIRCVARDVPEPSPMAHEILNARPYAFLDNAPLEERRTQAVYTRRAGQSSGDAGLGILDQAAIEQVTAEAWPRATNADELHDALLISGVLIDDELKRISADAPAWLDVLVREHRVGRIADRQLWFAAERLPLIEAAYPGARFDPQPGAFLANGANGVEPEDAFREIVRGRLEISGPVTTDLLCKVLGLKQGAVDQALLALEGEGFVLRGKFHAHSPEPEWCDRRLLARIHRLTITRLRAEIKPVAMAEFLRFLAQWMRLEPGNRAEGPEGLLSVIESLDAFEAAASAWEPDLLTSRMQEYDPRWLDQLCFTGRVGWGRLSARQKAAVGPEPRAPMSSPVRSSPVALFVREHLPDWLALSPGGSAPAFSPDTAQVLDLFTSRGALFFSELLKQRSLLPSRAEQALAELAAEGVVTSDSFEGLRALLLPRDKRIPFTKTGHKRHHKSVSSVEFAGRWALLRNGHGYAVVPGDMDRENHARGSKADAFTSRQGAGGGAQQERARRGDDERSAPASVPRPAPHDRDAALETFARVLLRRYGVIFRRLLERESLDASWLEIGRACRRMEARGEIRGGYFVGGVGGEQFALPEAVGLLRSMRNTPGKGDLLVISAADPLNLAGILTAGKRIAAFASNRVLLRDGVPIAALEAGEVLGLQPEAVELAGTLERRLRIGSMAAALRPYYA